MTEAALKGKDLGGAYRVDDTRHFVDGLSLPNAKILLFWLVEHNHSLPGCSGELEDGTYTIYWRR
jgi:hypothetical protein